MLQDISIKKADEASRPPGRNLNTRSDTDWTALPGPLSRHVSEIWSLVLIARGIDHRVISRDGRFYITVSPPALESAIEEIQLYEEENPSRAETSPAMVDERGSSNFAWIFLVAMAFMSAMLNSEIHPEVLEVGAARAGEIASGHIWLGLTALTLHSDPEHLLANMLLGGFVLSYLARQIGTGLAFALVLLSGWMGNIMNAYIQPAGHISIGSSTAVFGAISIIASINAVIRRTLSAKDFALPLFAALALLGFTGTQGERTDILAHLCGFLNGLIIGTGTGILIVKRGAPHRYLSPFAGAATSVAMVISWFLAWTIP